MAIWESVSVYIRKGENRKREMKDEMKTPDNPHPDQLKAL